MGHASHFAHPPQRLARRGSPRKKVAIEQNCEVGSDGDITDDDDIDDDDAETPVENNEIRPVFSRKRKFL